LVGDIRRWRVKAGLPMPAKASSPSATLPSCKWRGRPRPRSGNPHSGNTPALSQASFATAPPRGRGWMEKGRNPEDAAGRSTCQCGLCAQSPGTGPDLRPRRRKDTPSPAASSCRNSGVSSRSWARLYWSWRGRYGRSGDALKSIRPAECVLCVVRATEEKRPPLGSFVASAVSHLRRCGAYAGQLVCLSSPHPAG
jgi:hypothetical protein